jgi:DNA helicase-2/ATP-dependent DNA helicase PcrA
MHAANRRIYGQWTSSLPSRFVDELPEAHIETETTMSAGESLWRAQWSERADPFAHLGPAQSMRVSTRGPGWQRASQTGRFNRDRAPKKRTSRSTSFSFEPLPSLRGGLTAISFSESVLWRMVNES